jgi:hypothetical protein
MNKSILQSTMLTFFMLVSGAFFSSINAQNPPPGLETALYAGGDGSEASPYIIEDWYHLDNVRQNPDAYFILGNDIGSMTAGYDHVASETAYDGHGFTPIGNSGNRFTGHFNGNGHKILNLYINRGTERYVGMFGFVDNNASIENVGLVDANVEGDSDVGGLVGQNRGLVSESYVTGSVNGNGYGVGGLVGENNGSGTVNRSYATCGVSGNGRIGGLIGENWGTVSESYATGNVNGSIFNVGGLVGGNGGTVSRSYATGMVTGDGFGVGGLIGESMGFVEYSFWNTESTGQNDDNEGHSGIGLTTAEMRDISTFTNAGWDFDTIWQIEEPESGRVSYPFLQSNPQDPAPGGLYVMNTNADLAELTISDGILSPAFDPETINYTLEVDYQILSVTITPVTDDENATASVTGGDELKLGNNTVTVSVIAEDGATVKDYLINVVRNHPFANGEGTEADPYQIATAEQLDYVRDFLDKDFIQTADIDLGVSPWKDGEGWEPIGNSDRIFEGQFDGNGHHIVNLEINRENETHVGLFGVAGSNSVIKNLGLINVSVVGGDRTGALVGESRAEVGNVYTTGSVEGSGYTGGVIGIIEGMSTVSESYSAVDVSGAQRTGGFSGYLHGTLVNSYVAGGSVTGMHGSNGGLFGVTYEATVSHSYSAIHVMDGGPIVGADINNASLFLDNFWDTELSGGSNSDGGTGVDTPLMKTQSTFTDAGWDFDEVWQITDEDGTASYPYLQNNPQSPAPGLYELSDNADLAELNLSAGDLEPGFDSGVTTYTAEVGYTVEELNITPATGHPGAVVVVDGERVQSGEPSQPISLDFGDNEIDIIVTAENGDETTYRVTVTRNVPFSSGSGTEANPYEVSTADQLNGVRYFLESHFIQTADIDLDAAPYNQGEGWEPIGPNFSGTYDGNNHVINNLTIHRSDQSSIGLFGRIRGAELLNLGLIDVDVNGQRFVGALFGDDGSAPSTITNIYITGQVTGVWQVGGLTGEGYNSTTIANSYSSADVDGNESVGGLVGKSTRSSVIRDSYSTGRVAGHNEIGGLVGRNDVDSEIINSYSSGVVIGNNNTGGFVGVNENGGTISESFWDVETSGIGSPGDDNFGATGQNTLTMRSKTTFTDAGWDFDEVWQINERPSNSISYPYLQNNTQDPAPGLYELSDNADLAELNLSEGDLEPGFNSDVTTYTAEVGYTVEELTITPVADHPEATVDVDGQPVISGEASQTITLDTGNNEIDITVTAENGTETTYRVTVVRNAPFAGGSGTEADPWQISTAEELDRIRHYREAYFIQIADIDLGLSPWHDGKGWEPVGSETEPFTGSYNGNEFIIENLTIDVGRVEYLGLFSHLEGRVTNLTLTQVNLHADYSRHIGGVAGELSEGGIIQNSRVSGELFSGDEVNSHIGGLAGDNFGTISSSGSSVTVTGTRFVGGITGINWESGAIEDSYFDGTVLPHSAMLEGNQMGGIAGASYGEITRSFSEGEITGDSFIGGLAGLVNNGGRVTDSYSFAAVQGNSSVSGLVGTLMTGSVERSFAAGEVTSSSGDANGLAGMAGNGSVAVSFWDMETTGVTGGSWGSGLSSIGMKLKSTFEAAGWDFAEIWEILEAPDGQISYPRLQSHNYDEFAGVMDVGLAGLHNDIDIQESGLHASFQAEIDDTGNLPVVRRGFVLSEDPDFDTIDQEIVSEEEDLVFVAEAFDLIPLKTYYVRAFAENEAGIAYGDIFSLSTSAIVLNIRGDFTAKDKIYDGTTHTEIETNNLTLQGTIPSDLDDVAIDYIRLKFDNPDAGDDITVVADSISLSGSDAKFYVADWSGVDPAQASISRRPVTISADSLSKVYGDDDPELTFSADGFLTEADQDGFEAALIRDEGEDAGLYAIGIGQVAIGENYRVVLEAPDFEITPAVLTVTPDAEQQKFHHEDDPEITFTATGYQFDDDESVFEGALVREEGESPGEYIIQPGDLSAGDNYTLEFDNALFRIIRTAPVIVRFDPEENAERIAADTEIEAEFDYTVKIVEEDKITISNEEGEPADALFETDGAVLRILPGDRLNNDSWYTVRIEEGALVNLDEIGNEMDEWRFRTIMSGPVAEEISPEDGSEFVDEQAEIEVLFNQPVTSADEAGISVTGDHGHEADIREVSAQDNRLTITHSGLHFLREYTVVIGSGAVENSDGVGNSTYSWTFTTRIPDPHTVQLVSPEDEAEHTEIRPGFEWDSAEYSDFYQFQLSGDGNFDNPLMELDQPETSITPEDPLAHNHTYSWRVRGVNRGGPGEWSEVRTLSTIEQVPGQVALTSPADGEGSVATDAELEWSEAERAGQYQIEIAADAAFEEVVASESGLEDPVYNPDPSLDFYKQYFWRVRAENSGGTGPWSEAASFVTEAAVPEMIFPGDDAEAISIAPEFRWDTVHEEANIRIRIADDVDFEQPVVEKVTTALRYQVTGLDESTTYYWKIRVEDEATTSRWSEVQRFTTRIPPEETPPVTHRYEFPDTDDGGHIKSEDFRLVGLPGDAQLFLDNVFSGTYADDWRAFSDDGSTEDYLVEFDTGQNRFLFGSGAGYWVYHREEIDLDGLISHVELDESDSYPISLQPGWNIISNPFTGAVDWDAVLEFNDIQADLYGYDAIFTPSDRMMPFEGYYFYNDPSLEMEELRIPYGALEQRRYEEEAEEEAEPANIEFIARFHTGRDSGVKETSIRMVLNAEQPELAVSPHPSLSNTHYGMVWQDEQEGQRSLRVNTGLYDGTGTDHRIHLKAPERQMVQLEARFENADERMRILLVNPYTNRSYMVRSGDLIDLELTEPEMAYQVMIGDELSLMEQQSSMLPGEIILEQNYPNPFNPQTMIRYTLVEQVHVQLEVYDMLGRRVQTLVNESQSPGWHTVEFDGSKLSSGMYLYRLAAGGQVTTGRMTLVK